MDPGSVNDALTLIARVVALGKRATHVEYEEALQTAREVILKQKEINLDLREENRDLKEKLTVAKEYILDKSVYWKKDDTNQDQPFCPSCYAKGKIVPLQKLWEGRPKTQSPWRCPNKECGTTFNPWDHKENYADSEPVTPFFTPQRF